MQRPRIPVLLAAALTACTPDLHFQGTPRFSHEPGYHRPADSSAGTEIIPEKHLYLTAVRFPEGFDWEQDTCSVDGSVWLDLYRDTVLTASFPAGESIHPDMHRYRQGHLYADWSTAAETVLRRDGSELFRFEGRESLRGFLVLDGAVHTLGQDRDGNGLTYRIDGHAVFRSDEGTVLGDLDRGGREGGALSAEGEHVYYSYRIPTANGLGFKVMRDAELFRTISDAVQGTVYDLLVQGGTVYTVYSEKGHLYLSDGDGPVALPLRSSGNTLWAQLVPSPESMLVLACLSTRSGKKQYLLEPGGEALPFEADETVSPFLADPEGSGWLLSDRYGRPLRFCRPDGKVLPIGSEGYLASGHCALVHQGKLILALTGQKGAPGRLWQEGKETLLPFNGYFTSITVE